MLTIHFSNNLVQLSEKWENSPDIWGRMLTQICLLKEEQFLMENSSRSISTSGMQYAFKLQEENWLHHFTCLFRFTEDETGIVVFDISHDGGTDIRDVDDCEI